MSMFDNVSDLTDDEPETGAEPEEKPEAEAAKPEHEDEGGKKPATVKVEIERPMTRTERRKADAQRAVDEAVGGISSKFETALKESREAQARELAELRSLLMQRAAQPQQSVAPVQQQAQQPTAQDVQRLMKEAKKALDANDFEGYQEKFMEAAELRAILRMKAEMPAQQPSGPQPLPPQLYALMAQHPAVAAAGDRGAAYVHAETIALQADNWQPGPELAAEAFRRAALRLQQGKAPAAPNGPAARAALSGTPTQRPTARTPGKQTVELTPSEKAMADKFGTSYADYAAELAVLHPERVKG